MKLSSVSTLLCALGAVAQDTFENPVLWQDLADLDILRVDDTYYYSASTMHYSPGAPVLRSYDLVNWEFVGHSVPTLDFGPEYNLDGGRAYVQGIWASFLNYRPSNGLFYWGGCMRTMQTHIYTAEAPEGPWERITILDNCYYDAGLLIDDDDKMYVAYGEHDIIVAELSDDGTSEVNTQQVYSWTEEDTTIEGSRFYKIDGNYYIFVTRPADAQYILKSTDGPTGPYEIQPVVDAVGSPVASSGSPHQGGIVDTPDGDWYYMAFVDAYPGGRIPVLAPMTWGDDGWPTMELVDGNWGASYPMPNASAGTVKPITGTDSFNGTSLGAEWEWNHNPDNSKWSVDNGLTLQAATVTDDLYMARNTLTHRILGPSSTGTIALDYSSMTDGDRAGFVLLRDKSAYIGVVKDGDAIKVSMVDTVEMNADWTNTTNTGSEVESAEISDGSGQIWLRISANISPDSNFEGTFSYSTDGANFTSLGTAYVMDTSWEFFMGYRFGIFNFATLSLGGAVTVSEFDLAANLCR